MYADGVSGSMVELDQGGEVIGKGEINRHGGLAFHWSEMPSAYPRSACQSGNLWSGWLAYWHHQVDDREYLSPPIIVEPIFVAATIIGLEGLIPRLHGGTFAGGTSLGTLCSRFNRINVIVRA
jgi:hypothetical protein